MCGIAGYISKEQNLINEKQIKDTLNLMKRRGPDNTDYKKINYSNCEINLLHSRLNIIDLHPRSNQPFEQDGYQVVFNGEIYNFLEIKKKLIDKFEFKTQSDTEVLLKSYIFYGDRCVEHFNGMWAFAIWDPHKKKLFLSRDPFGEKPLYFSTLKNSFLFGSEIKFIRSLSKIKFEFNKDLIKKNLFLGYKSVHKDNQTFFENIFSVKNGENIFVDTNLNIKKEIYWKPKLSIDHKMKYSDAVSNTLDLLLKSLKFRLRSDVPIAFCLSGGVDSSLLASLAKKKLNLDINTFSIFDNDERYDELENIKLINNNLKSNSTIIDVTKLKSNFLKKVEEITIYHDSPLATISYYIHALLTEKISKNFKVTISGLGADEIFTGYYDHYLSHLATVKGLSCYNENLSSWKTHVLPIIRNKSFKNPLKYIEDPKNRDGIYETVFGLDKFSKTKFEDKFEEKKFCKEILRNRMFNEINFETLPVMLKHDDLNSMYNSIENRSPFLDKDLYNFSLTIPAEHLIKKGFQKKILRDVGDNILDNRIRLARQKKGFNASLNSCLDFEDRRVKKFLFDKKSPINEFVNVEKMQDEIEFDKLQSHMSKYIFSFITTKIFLGDRIQ